MAQKLFEDKITTLQNAGSNIIMPAGARLTIGGQQYVTTTSLQVAANLTSANTRYQIFAVLNAGAVQLVVSANENSQGPAGYSVWKLVGSYYTNGLTSIGFGSFVTITGVPRTQEIQHFPLINTNSGTLQAGTGGSANQTGFWSRNGREMKYSFNLRFGTSGIGTGNSNYEVILPGVRRRRPALSDTSLEVYGTGMLYDVSTNANYPMMFAAQSNTPDDETLMVATTLTSSNITVSSTNPFSFTTGDLLRGEFTIEVQEFDNTPIEDL